WVGGPSSETSSHGWAGRPVRLLATRRASASGEPFVRCGAKPSQQKSIIEFGFNPWMNGRRPEGWGGRRFHRVELVLTAAHCSARKGSHSETRKGRTL